MTVLDTDRCMQHNQLASVDLTCFLFEKINCKNILRQLEKFGYIGKYPDKFLRIYILTDKEVKCHKD